MNRLAYTLMVLSLLATIGVVIEAPALVPLFILFWCVVLGGGKLLALPRPFDDPDRQSSRAHRHHRE